MVDLDSLPHGILFPIYFQKKIQIFLLKYQWLTEYKTSSKIPLRQGIVHTIFIEVKSSDLEHQKSCLEYIWSYNILLGN